MNATLTRRLALVVLAGLSIAAAPTARADDDGWHGEGRGHGNGHHRHHHRDQPYVVYGEPAPYGYYVEEERPVYVVPRPRPVYVYPRPYYAEPSINFVFPLNLR